MSVRAKFKVSSIEESESGKNIKLSAVTNGSEENEIFFKWSPSGSIQIGILNPETAAQFVVGREYYVDFKLADTSEN